MFFGYRYPENGTFCATALLDISRWFLIPAAWPHMSFRPRIPRLRSRTSAMSIAKPSWVMPNSLLRRKYDATFALWMIFLLGKHAMFGHDPPMYLRSTTATCFPSPANVHAAMVEPVPPPRITRSNSSGCVFLSTWADEVLSVRFMRRFLSEP